MKNIIIIALALLAGLVIGYFIFGNKPAMDNSSMPHQHEEAATSESAQEYTCSMHPQIRQNEPGICPICEMDLVPLVANTSNDPLVLQMTEAAVKLSNIQTTLVGKGDEAQSKVIQLNGKVQADERRASSLVAHLPGRIEKLYVTYTSEAVQAGQKLADIYSPELITAQRELLEALKLQDVNPQLLEATRNKFRYWKIGPQTINNIETSGRIQESFTLYAESSGIVSNRRIAVGDYINKGQALFDLVNLNKVWVLFDAYEEDLGQFAIGDPIEFSTPAIPGKTFKTKITFIDPIINPNTRVAALRTEVSNRQGLLKPEQFVTGVLKKTKRASNTPLSIPRSAVLWTGKRSVVYVKVPDVEIPSFEYREVELGKSLGDSYQIINGLEAGEEVVTYGSFAIDAAAQLNNQASMMNKNVSLKKEKSNRPPDYHSETPVAFQQQLNEVSEAYLTLKNALVATDPLSTKEASKVVLDKLEQTDMSLVKGEAHLFWMQQLNVLTKHSEKISEEEDVEKQRQQFEFVSDALIKTIQAFGISGDSLYVQYCPMALDDSGANWLSDKEIIQNPYFGDKMMKCGAVKGVVK